MPVPQRSSHELRADVAALLRKVDELREWVAHQQAEIDRLQQAAVDLRARAASRRKLPI